MLSLCEQAGLSEAVIVACVQAAATLEAGRLQAAATSRSSSITLITGLIAVAGVLFAAHLTYNSAMASVTAERDRQQARIAGYKRQIVAVIEEISSPILGQFAAAQMLLEDWRKNGGSYSLVAADIAWDKHLHPDLWELHSLLGTDFVAAIYRLHNAKQNLVNFVREMNGRKVDDYSNKPTITPVSDGSYELDPAITQYAKVMDEMYAALVDVRTCLGLPPGEVATEEAAEEATT